MTLGVQFQSNSIIQITAIIQCCYEFTENIRRYEKTMRKTQAKHRIQSFKGSQVCKIHRKKGIHRVKIDYICIVRL
jgi:hypothetical protein